MNADLVARTLAWIDQDPDPETAAELRAILDGEDEKDLAERMAGPLEFGTAGLRGLLGAGESRMNRAVVRRTARGLATYLRAHAPDAVTAGVVIGYDGRHYSRVFAEETARILAYTGIVAYLFPDVAPTPLTSFAVTHLGCAAGVMVTASHNPPAYNGYKVYWRDGAQIIPPHDGGIAEAIAAVGSAKDVPLLDESDARGRNLWRNVSDEVVARYHDALAALSQNPAGREHVRIVYTPLHGVGDRDARACLARFGFTNVWSVPAQQKPDGDFPTVAFPNPEEPGALDLSYALAREKNATLILANDPDADRLAVAVPDGRGAFRQLTGNETGVLLADYLLRATTSEGAKRVVMTTIVSSPMLARMAARYDVRYAEVLTGFKWIATTAMRLEKEENLAFLFGYEEALGYTVKTVARDKDGIGAAAMFAELVAVAAAAGKTVDDELERLGRADGVYASGQHSVTKTGVSGASEIAAIMDRLRRDPPKQVGALAVQTVRDLQKGARATTTAKTPLTLPPSNVLIFDLADDARVIVRPSGTEPKIKFYFDVRTTADAQVPFAQARARAEEALEELRRQFLKALSA